MDVRLPNGTVVQGVPDGTTRAQLAQKLKANGRDVPSEWLGSEWDDNSALPDKTKPAVAAPGDTRSEAQKLADRGSMATDMVMSATGSVLAPFRKAAGDLAGLGRAAYEGITSGSKGDGDAPGRVQRNVTSALAPRANPETQAMMAPVNRAVGAVAAPVGQILHGVADMARGDGPANSPRVMAANAGIEAVKQVPNLLVPQVPKAATAAGNFTSKLTGSAARTAREEALAATRGALGTVDKTLAGQQATKTGEAGMFADKAASMERDLAGARTGVPTTAKIGDEVRGRYTTLMQQADEARQKATAPLYDKSKEAAAAREASGARIDVAPAVADIRKMLELSDNLPDLQAKLETLRQAVEGVPERTTTAPPIGSGKVTAGMRPPKVAPAATQGLTYEQLALANRRIKDIAFTGEQEGYSAVIRNAAKKLSVELDKQISKFVPEHAEAAAMYRKMSEPMETLTTRYGRAIADTEGGLTGQAYSRVAAQDLPGRIFSKREGIQQLVDAIAGGKGATPAARAEAQAFVDKQVENWVLSGTMGKVGAEARSAVQAPGVRSALEGSPTARANLERTFSAEEAKARGVPEVKVAAAKSEQEAQAIAAQREKIATRIQQAETDLQAGNPKKAYEGYVEALRANMAQADPERYRAAIGLIERAGNLQAKTEKARKLALGVAKGVGLGAAGALGFKAAGYATAPGQ